MKLSNFKVLSFDCYGTLIDWETGILNALRPLTDRLVAPLTSNAILESYARHEATQQTQNPCQLYPELLAVVHQKLADEWKVRVTEIENQKFGDSIKDWPAFPDSTAALQYLKKYFKLVILSNVDRESFRHSNQRLDVEFDQIHTSEEIGSYKPSLLNFQYLLARIEELGFMKSDLLHTAESLFHDHAPANRLRVASAWIHRRHAQRGSGATSPPDIVPHYDFRFNSLREMADAHARELSSLGPLDNPH